MINETIYLRSRNVIKSYSNYNIKNWPKSCLTFLKISFFWLILSGPGFSKSDVGTFSLDNTNFVVLIAFIIFLGILIYYKVPNKIINLLDDRADSIKNEIDEANHLLEEAKTILAQLEREHKENIARAELIVKDAETSAEQMIADSKADIKEAIARKIKMAESQVSASEKAIMQEIKDRAIDLSIDLAKKDLAKRVDSKLTDKLFTDSVNGFGQIMGGKN